jgi:hypothetical protein
MKDKPECPVLGSPFFGETGRGRHHGSLRPERVRIHWIGRWTLRVNDWGHTEWLDVEQKADPTARQCIAELHGECR